MLSDTPSFRFLAACLLLPLSTAQHVVVPGSVPGSLFSPHGLPPATSAPRHQQSEVKILVCGDSISQGKENDFTWRYRLWEWFEQQSTTTTTSTTPTLKYVGPYNGTLPSIIPESALYTNPDNPFEVPKPQTWGTYHPSVSPAFSPLGGSAHFAVYGRPAWQDIDLLAEQVTTHQPDLVILHLGFNDIGWWGATPESLTETVQQLVWNARTAKRDVAVLIADVSHRLLVGGREDIPGTTDRYNKLLREKAAEWSHEDSPVVAVGVSEEYDCEFGSSVLAVAHRHGTFFFLLTDRPNKATSTAAQRASMDSIPTQSATFK